MSCFQNYLENSGALSRMRSHFGIRKSAPSAVKSYTSQQKVRKAIIAIVPESKADCKALALSLGTIRLDQERVTAWIYNLNNAGLDACEELIENNDLLGALVYVARRHNRPAVC